MLSSGALNPPSQWGDSMAQSLADNILFDNHLFWMFRYKHGHIASMVPQRFGYSSAHRPSLHVGHMGLYSR